MNVINIGLRENVERSFKTLAPKLSIEVEKVLNKKDKTNN